VDLREIEWMNVYWINVAGGMDKCFDHGTKLRFAQKAGNLLTSQGPVIF